MKYLLLLLVVVIYFYPISAIEIVETLSLNLKYSKCAGSKPIDGKEAQLRPREWRIVITDKATGLIERTIALDDHTHYETGKAPFTTDDTYTWSTDKEIFTHLPIDASKTELHVVVFVGTRGNDNMDGIDNQIFYGYNPFRVWLKDSQAKPYEELGESPFRIGEMSFILEKKSNGKKYTIFESKEKACDPENYDAWIANHGIYRVEKNAKGEPYFTNLYYWPQRGRIFT